MDTKIPSLYQKRDQNFYFTYKGKQYYAGSTREAATQKLLEIVGTANADGPHSIKDAVKGYLDSIEGVQSPDSVISKRRTYKRVFALLPQVKSIYDITPEVLEAFRSKLLKTLEKTSVNSTFLQLSAFLQHFVEKGVLLQNSARKLPGSGPATSSCPKSTPGVAPLAPARGRARTGS
jgi:hypothetical protein